MMMMMMMTEEGIVMEENSIFSKTIEQPRNTSYDGYSINRV